MAKTCGCSRSDLLVIFLIFNLIKLNYKFNHSKTRFKGSFYFAYIKARVGTYTAISGF